MAHLIDKDALVAWAKETYLCENASMIRKACYKQFLEHLDTLEVKEVDLENEIDKWWCSQFTDYSMKRVPNHKFIPAPAYTDSNFKQSETGKTKIAYELCIDWKVDANDIEWNSETIREFAKHFFKLGLKTQKGEQVDYGKLKTSLDDALSKETKESWEKFLQEEEKKL